MTTYFTRFIRQEINSFQESVETYVNDIYFLVTITFQQSKASLIAACFIADLNS